MANRNQEEHVQKNSFPLFCSNSHSESYPCRSVVQTGHLQYGDNHTSNQSSTLTTTDTESDGCFTGKIPQIHSYNNITQF